MLLGFLFLNFAFSGITITQTDLQVFRYLSQNLTVINEAAENITTNSSLVSFQSYSGGTILEVTGVQAGNEQVAVFSDSVYSTSLNITVREVCGMIDQTECPTSPILLSVLFDRENVQEPVSAVIQSSSNTFSFKAAVNECPKGESQLGTIDITSPAVLLGSKQLRVNYQIEESGNCVGRIVAYSETMACSSFEIVGSCSNSLKPWVISASIFTGIGLLTLFIVYKVKTF